MSEDVRPFFGERAKVLEAPEWQPPIHMERHTMQGWREAKIADGFCPMPGCNGHLDDDYFCSLCGNVSLPGQRIPDDETTWSVLNDDQIPMFDEAGV